jgi:hypothetical protein
MKNHSIFRQISILILFALIIFRITESFSQHVMTFKDGTELKVFITYQTKDTVKYFLTSNPNVIYGITTDNIDTITPIEAIKGHITDNTMNNTDYKKYLHYKRVFISGIVLMPIGAVLFGLGAFSSTSDINSGMSRAFAIGLGGGLFITGAIKAIAGSAKMNKYKEKLHGFTFDLKCTPQQQGIAVVYRF